jgi:hypothetical protein
MVLTSLPSSSVMTIFEAVLGRSIVMIEEAGFG